MSRETEFEADEFESEFEGDDGDEAVAAPAARPVTGRGVVVNKGELSRFTGIAVVTIDRMVAEGAPILARGGSRKQGWQINSADWIGWYIRHKITEATGDPDASSFDEAKRRDKEAQARLRELEIAKREGELVPVSEVEAWASDKFGVVRSRFLTVETQVPGLTDEQREALKIAIGDAFADVSGFSADRSRDFSDDFDDSDSA